MFVNRHIVNLNVTNPPPDMVIVDAAFSVDEGEAQPMECIETTEPGRWDCAFVPDDISGSEGVVDTTLEVFASLSYGVGAGINVEDYFASKEFQVEKRLSKALESCQKEIERLETQMDRLKANQAGYDDFGWMYYLLGVMYIALGWYLIYSAYPSCVSSCGPAAPACVAGCKPILVMGIMMVATGGLYIVLGAMSSDTGAGLGDTQIMELEFLIDEKKEICSSRTFEEVARNVGDINPLSPVVYG